MDIDKYVERATRLDTSGIDLGSFGSTPLDPGTLRCLRYMHDVECHTVCYLRDLLVTSAHLDPETTTFLTLWNYEEFFHGMAIASVLSAHGEPAGRDRTVHHRAQLGTRDRLMPFAHAIASWLAGCALSAVHMAWGAVNELTTQGGYSRLAARSANPVLADLLHRIMRQEGRHIDFYSSRAERLLAESGRARRLTRLALSRLWSPVGASVMPQREVRFVVSYLFGGTEGQAGETDRPAYQPDARYARTEPGSRFDREIRRLSGRVIDQAEPLRNCAQELGAHPPSPLSLVRADRACLSPADGPTPTTTTNREGLRARREPSTETSRRSCPGIVGGGADRDREVDQNGVCSTRRII